MGVRLRHPTLDSEIEVPAEAVPHHERSGWVQVKGQAEQGETWPEELQRFEGQEQVRMRHPTLDDEIVVARSAVPLWRERGWEEITESTPPGSSAAAAAAGDAQAEPDPEPPRSTQRASRSRRTTQQQQQSEPEEA
jgi:hypothetical protein